MTLTTSIGYIGTKCIEAIREVGVINANAKTEYNMQKQLVDVELRSYQAKKEYSNSTIDE
ncbi:MAG: hypothetical protein L6V95_04965 [Candidatus Melainabacteria bacterium]|nr:MAG: hypothetical protein L6V95_04965 [Candidatus Melainabacteria bacterium]